MSKEINGYKLSRDWFDFCFENPEKIKPNHTALYFFAIEHCNRLGWKNKFGFPTTMAMEAIGIKSYTTYINTLKDIVDWGFIEMVERSTNQYSSNIIALSKFDKALDKALDKAMIKHKSKQVESNVSINKQVNNVTKEQVNNSSVIAIADDVPNASDSETWHSAIRVANRLLESICEYDPTHKYNKNDPSIRTWVKDIDLALRRDVRTEEQFNFLIDAIFYNSHKFPNLWDQWAVNIESGAKLRSQFDKIKNQIKTTNGQSINHKIREAEEFLSSYEG